MRLKIIDVLRNFDEGCELTDAIQSMLCAADTLSGIGHDRLANILIVEVQFLIKETIDYMESYREQYETYANIPVEIFDCIGYYKLDQAKWDADEN